MKTLIFESEITGHHSEYIDHLVKYISSDSRQDEKYYFIVHPKFKTIFPKIVEISKKTLQIEFIEIEKEDHQNIINGPLIIKSLKSYNVLRKYAQRYHADRVLLMHLNIFQFALACYRPKFVLSGILFKQFYRLEKRTLSQKLTYFRKYLITWMYAKNRKIENVFVLNDENSCFNLNKKLKTSIFTPLPDPVPNLLPEQGYSIREHHQIDKTKTILLHFGSLSIRKGTFEILDAIMLLNESILNKLSFLFIGRTDIDTDTHIKFQISKIKEQFPDIKIGYRNEFIKDTIMKSYFNQCDYLLTPYKNTEASSGIIGHAIASGKPVIAIKKGLLGELVKENNSGILIEDSSSKEIASAINRITNDTFSFNDSNDFLATHSPEVFAKTLLNHS